MRLDDHEPGSGDGVTEGDAVVGERSRVEDHAVDVAPSLVEPTDQLALDVRLEVDDRDAGGRRRGARRSAMMSSNVSWP